MNHATNRPLFSLYVSALVLIAATLAACGGGGSDASDTAAAAAASSPASSASAASPTTPTTPASPTTPVTSAGSTCGIADFAATALARINQLRAAGADCHTQGSFAPAAPLTWSAQLTQSSEALSQDMVAHNFFSHTGSDGSTLKTRVDATGYAWSSLGENIAAGYSGLEAVLTGWMASDGHCANLMDPDFNQVGLVCVPGTAANTFNTYWTMDLAKSR
jgi:uncharacterized protein YkwD